MFTSRQALLDYFKAHKLSDDAQKQLEYLRAASPMRDVGKSALMNTVTRVYSHLMGRHLVCESRTVEALCYMLAEISGQVLEIWPQIEMRGVTRVKDGRRHVSSPTTDALILTEVGPAFLECKTQEELERLHKEKPNEYAKNADGSFTRPALETWAKERGCKYLMWSPPKHYGLLWANIELIHPLLRKV